MVFRCPVAAPPPPDKPATLLPPPPPEQPAATKTTMPNAPMTRTDLPMRYSLVPAIAG
jgi:hypothetical protein